MSLAIEVVEADEGVATAPPPAAARGGPDRTVLVTLLGLAVAMEAAVGMFMKRLSLRQVPFVVPTPQPVASILGVTEKGLTWFVVALTTMVLCHLAAYAVALRLKDPRYGIAAFAVAVVLSATMIPVFPGGAHDVYHNVADARTLWVYHEDPITTPPNAHPADPLVIQLAYWPELTSSYGPVWYLVSGLPLPFTGGSMARNVVGQKILVTAFLLGTLWLVYLMVKRLRPGAATAAVVLFGWSPLVLWEIAGNAHNDIVMLFFAVAALYVVQRGRWQWAFPLLALAVGVKFIMLLLGPLLLAWLLWRRPRIDRRELLISMAAAGAVLALIYLPFIVASHSLANADALTDRYISSPTSLAIALFMQYTSLPRATDYARILALTVYAGGYLLVLLRCRGEFENLLKAAFWATFLTLVLPTWWFWPWYLVWLAPLAALASGSRRATLGVVFGSSALLVYPIYYWRDVLLNGPNWYANQFVIVGAVFGPVLIYLLSTSGSGIFTLDTPAASDLAAA
jgi:ALG3 protein